MKTRQLPMVLGLLIAPSAFSQSVVSWGGAPSGAPERVSRLVVRDGLAAGILPGGTAACWGPITQVPTDLGMITEVAVSSDGVVALRRNGTVACWLVNPTSICTAPADIDTAVDVATSSDNFFALLSDGTIRQWGNPSFAYNTDNLVGSIRIEAHAGYLGGLRSDGQLRIETAYGSSEPIPPLATEVVQFAIYSDSRAAVRADGSVFTWGRIADFGYLPPSDLGLVERVALGDLRAIALLRDGTVRAWGHPDWTIQPPAGLPPAAEVAVSSGNGYVVRLDTDCDQNGVRDSLELAEHDCNSNGMHDSCEAEVGALEDCNGNGLGDACEKQLTVQLSSGPLGPIGVNQPQNWEIPNAIMAAAPVRIKVRARGDFSGQLEYATLRLGDHYVGTAFAGTADCGITPWFEFEVPDFVFNGAIDLKGRVTLHCETTIAVDPLLCPKGTWIEAVLAYVGAAPSDCNANGLLDSCEIAAGLAVDANGNGAIDICESAFASCPADFDQDGHVNGADLAQLLNAWGPAPGLPGLDLNPDGVINGADLAILLNAWGLCAN